MFTQPISMDCTFEQYHKFLKEPLKEMGYKEWFIGGNTKSWRDVILTNHGDRNDRITDLQREYCSNYNCTYLGSFNAPLFLALAAMTDKAEGNYGEYVKGLNTGILYRMSVEDKILPEYNMVRKATKEELMAKFGGEIWNQNKSTDAVDAISYSVGRMPKDNRIYKLNEKGQIEINVLFGATETTEIDAINLLKSKGYKILKPKTWEEV